jgi:hypothetical protein
MDKAETKKPAPTAQHRRGRLFRLVDPFDLAGKAVRGGPVRQ